MPIESPLSADAIAVKKLLEEHDWSFLSNEAQMKVTTELYEKEQISRDLYETIWLMKRETDENRSGVIAHPLLELDEKGEYQFTRAAEEIFIPAIANNPTRPEFTKEKQAEFKARLQALPPEQRVFLTHKNAHYQGCLDVKACGEHPLSYRMDDFENKKALTFYLYAIYYKSILISKDWQQVIHPELGMYNAVLGPILYGEDYRRRVPKEGIISTREMEEGIKQGIRYIMSVVSGSKYPLSPHDRSSDTLTSVGHDWYHADLFSSIPINFNQAYDYMIDLIRGHMDQVRACGRFTSQHVSNPDYVEPRRLTNYTTWQLTDRADSSFDPYLLR